MSESHECIRIALLDPSQDHLVWICKNILDFEYSEPDAALCPLWCQLPGIEGSLTKRKYAQTIC